jgi:hypothetical protein
VSDSQPHYPLLNSTSLRIALAVLLARRRSFLRDAQALVSRLDPPPAVEGEVPDLTGGGWVVAMNHYVSPTLRAWWLGLSVTAALGEEVHWVMSTAWTYADPLRSRLVTPVTEWVFRRTALVYGFISMPPMPPRPWEVEARARAVREVLQSVKANRHLVIGLAPEGGDSPGSALMVPPPGVGRFLALLFRMNLRCLPVGIHEAEGRICIRLGSPLDGLQPSEGSSEARDRQVADQVMTAIAACLPPELRGAYG